MRVSITSRCDHWLASNCARAALVALRYCPQKSKFHDAPRPSWPRCDDERAQAAELRRRITLRRITAGAVERRELLRARDTELRLRFHDALRGNADIVVLLERCADQLLQLRIAKNLPPLLVADRKRGGGCAVRLAGERSAVQIMRLFAGLRVAVGLRAAVNRRCINGRALVFGTDGAACQQKAGRAKR